MPDKDAAALARYEWFLNASTHDLLDGFADDPSLLDEVRDAVRTKLLGPTGRYPRGRPWPEDEGELVVAVVAGDGQVLVSLGKPVTWLALPPAHAMAFAQAILQMAHTVQDQGGRPQ